MSYYSRENYLKKIRGFYHDAEMIKVITGVRRCGKSCLMQTIAEEIKAGGIAADGALSVADASFSFFEAQAVRTNNCSNRDNRIVDAFFM